MWNGHAIGSLNGKVAIAPQISANGLPSVCALTNCTASSAESATVFSS